MEGTECGRAGQEIRVRDSALSRRSRSKCVQTCLPSGIDQLLDRALIPALARSWCSRCRAMRSATSPHEVPILTVGRLVNRPSSARSTTRGCCRSEPIFDSPDPLRSCSTSVALRRAGGPVRPFGVNTARQDGTGGPGDPGTGNPGPE